jgi:hypothetical protein
MSDEGSLAEMVEALSKPNAVRWPKRGDKLIRPAKNWEDGVQFAE